VLLLREGCSTFLGSDLVLLGKLSLVYGGVCDDGAIMESMFVLTCHHFYLQL
jgi:hypothetical protein